MPATVRMLVEASGPLQTKEFPEVGCNVKRPTHFQLNWTILLRDVVPDGKTK